QARYGVVGAQQVSLLAPDEATNSEGSMRLRVPWRRARLQLPKRSPPRGDTQPETPSKTLPPREIPQPNDSGVVPGVWPQQGGTEPETPPTVPPTPDAPAPGAEEMAERS